MKDLARALGAGQRPLGLVPTMGALHDGHLSLVRRAGGEGAAVVVSIFVNPTQFGPAEDLSRYPRQLESDLGLLEPFGVEAVFAPAVEEMYPQGFDTLVEPGSVARTLEGERRPGHFRGVATVVLKLFSIISPDVAYFGQKDFQQTVVVHRLVQDFNLDVRLRICPIVREPDGLALSSRNRYLDADDRQAATVLYRSLERARGLVYDGQTDAARISGEMGRVFAAEPRAQLDYALIVDPRNLEPVVQVRSDSVALVAAQVGPARLIDNMILGAPGRNP